MLDANVLVSALLSRVGAPARLVERWLEGDLELVVCPRLLAEVERALRSPKLQERVSDEVVAEFLSLLGELALVPDPSDPPPIRSQDPGDDYVIALAARERARIASGDEHLLALQDALPIVSPRAALDLFDRP